MAKKRQLEPVELVCPECQATYTGWPEQKGTSCFDCFADAAMGLNDCNIKMAEQIDKIAPRCHLQPMALEQEGPKSWWECTVCGLEKPYY